MNLTKNTHYRTNNGQMEFAGAPDDKSAFVRIALRTSAISAEFPELLDYAPNSLPVYISDRTRVSRPLIELFYEKRNAMRVLKLLKENSFRTYDLAGKHQVYPELPLQIRSPELKIKKKEADAVTTVMNIAFKHVTVWLDLDYVPSADDLSGSQKICIEYEQADPAKLRTWLERVRMVYFNHRIITGSVVVFANYDNLNSAEVARLVGEFHELGAVFSGYPDGCRNFGCAIESYIETIRKIGERTAEFRKQLKGEPVLRSDKHKGTVAG